jgi:hypothetical protein
VGTALILVINSSALEVEDGPASTGRLIWGDDSKVWIFDARRRASKSPDEKSAITEAAEWSENFLALNNGRAASAEIKAPGLVLSHSTGSDARLQPQFSQVTVALSEDPIRRHCDAKPPPTHTS